MKTYRKDPAAFLDYGFDWSEWLTTDETIDACAVTITDGDATPMLDVVSVTNTNNTVTAWLADGANGSRYRVMCHIETNQGRVDERSVNVSVMDQ